MQPKQIFRHPDVEKVKAKLFFQTLGKQKNYFTLYSNDFKYSKQFKVKEPLFSKFDTDEINTK